MRPPNDTSLDPPMMFVAMLRTDHPINADDHPGVAREFGRYMLAFELDLAQPLLGECQARLERARRSVRERAGNELTRETFAPIAVFIDEASARKWQRAHPDRAFIHIVTAPMDPGLPATDLDPETDRNQH